ncbi:hypothetical protein SRABI96_00349 [Peribacillus sp. Bi96]|nr:hypothetical protein [Peribacillus sp. Bi96]CAH0135624.1 hypothetical protein SRABI96_00349 [Peribacillus sp. Bi96]
MGAKTKAAIVTLDKGAKGNLTWILQAALYTKDLTQVLLIRSKRV